MSHELCGMAKEKHAVKLCEVITRLAKKKYKSKLGFATACDLHHRTVGRIYAGKYNPSVLILEKIGDALDKKSSELLREAGM